METACLGDVRDIHVRLGDKEAAGFADPEQIGMGEQGDSRVFRKKTADAVGRHVHGSGNLLQSERRTEMNGKIIRQFRELLRRRPVHFPEIMELSGFPADFRENQQCAGVKFRCITGRVSLERAVDRGHHFRDAHTVRGGQMEAFPSVFPFHENV